MNDPQVLGLVSAPAMEPVQVHERIDAIDVLRGFALFGILCVNMMLYTTPLMAINSIPPYWPEPHNQIASWLIEFFAVGKFYVLFSFLFGLGIAIQAGRAERRAADVISLHARRMLVLLGFGLVHAYFIWMGDILTTYAVVGFVMLAFLKRQPVTCLIWAAVIYALVCAFFALVVLGIGALTLIPGVDEQIRQAIREGSAPAAAEAGGELAKTPVETEIERAKRIYSSGSWLEIMRLRAYEVLLAYVAVLSMQGWMVVVMFLLGLYVGKTDYFRRLPAYRGFLLRWRWPALVVGIAGNAAYLLGVSFLDWDRLVLKLVCILFGSVVGAPALSFFYVSSLLLLITPTDPERGPTVWQKRLRPLALTGRMALTNYLMQSVLCSLIFYSYGLGLYAQLGPAVGLAITVAIYAIQVLWSTWWLKRFRYGPMEWLWRSLTYGQIQPMRLA